MATKRKRGEVWEYTVRRKALLPKPLYLRFDSEAAGDDYVARLEAMLDRNIVPPELVEEPAQACKNLAEVIDAYRRALSLPGSDAAQLDVIRSKFGGVRMLDINYAWCEGWVRRMKRIDVLAPSTIRHYVGALARCLDWVMRSQPSLLPSGNPLRILPKRYATYTQEDSASLGPTAKAKTDVSRDRRLLSGEEARIRMILSGAKPAGKERSLALNHQRALNVLFDLALETAMRLREMYTLEISQIDFNQKTIFLEKTKNGDKRQVPLSSIADRLLREYLEEIGESGFSGRLFPWWIGNDSPRVLNKITSMLSQQFGRIFNAAGCADLNFHDLRHEATSRLFERTRLSDLQIAKITGHKDPRMLSRYANLRGSDLAGYLW